MLKLSTHATLRCMRCASRSGFNPYDSHAVQSAKWARAWADKARRARV